MKATPFRSKDSTSGGTRMGGALLTMSRDISQLSDLEFQWLQDDRRVGLEEPCKEEVLYLRDMTPGSDDRPRSAVPPEVLELEDAA